MRAVSGICAVAAAAFVAPAWAASEPVIAPPAAWVQPIPLPAPNAAQATKPFQILLFNSQAHHGPSTEVFVETATRLQDPQALAALGTIALPWHPDQTDLIVHKVNIVRDGAIIDILAKQKFTVVRRENNLERATLDGVLTAVIQPEGLATGDTLNIAFTYRRKPGALGLASENLFAMVDDAEIGSVRVREIWPQDYPMRWRATPLMGTPQIRKTKLGTELTLELANAKAPKAPADVPPRYHLSALLETSGYPDWNALGRRFAPLYTTAQTLADDSPLRVEIAKIAQSTQDPGQRAMAALRLVQDKVRYVALAMGDAGLVPATADQSWSRKYGDCKAKSALLIALLHGLGIDAEPVLVNTMVGDSLAERLPQIGLFDHVIVRVSINGRSYWLDGTRTGDRSLDWLASSPFGWGLPIGPEDAGLEQLPSTPPPLPLRETNVTYDASGGFERAVPVSGEIVFRGDFANLLQLSYAQLGKEEFRKKLRPIVAELPDDEAISAFDAKGDDATATFTVKFKARQSMDWSQAPASPAVRFQFGDEVIEWQPAFKREAGPFSDAPFKLPFPLHYTSRETVILPNNGAGFALDGKDLNMTVAGAEVSRKLTLADGKAVAYSSFRTLRSEASAVEGLAAASQLKALNADAAYVRAPADYRASKAEIDAIIAEQPTTAAGFNHRGYWLIQRQSYRAAVSDFEKASALEADWARPHANRALALVRLKRFEDAEKAIRDALAASDDEPITYQAQGVLDLVQDRPADAVRAFTQALKLDADNSYTVMQRAAAYERGGRLDAALDDVTRALAMENPTPHALWYQARLLAGLDKPDLALKAIDQAITLDPEEPFYSAFRGELLLRFGREAEAKPSFAAALKLVDAKIGRAGTAWVDPTAQKIGIFIASRDYRGAVAIADAALARQSDNVRMLTERCRARAEGGFELDKALRDCNRAEEYDPGTVGAAQARALVYFRMARWDQSIADYDRALSFVRNDPYSLHGRGLAKLRKGDAEGGRADIAAGRRYGFDAHVAFEASGITPETTVAGN